MCEEQSRAGQPVSVQRAVGRVRAAGWRARSCEGGRWPSGSGFAAGAAAAAVAVADVAYACACAGVMPPPLL